MRTTTALVFSLCSFIGLLGCGSEDSSGGGGGAAGTGAAAGAGGSGAMGASGGASGAAGSGGSAASSSVFDELVDLGVTQHFGTVTPNEETPNGDVTLYGFDPADGPMCLRGSRYYMSVRDQGSPNLFIYMQGGGACWSTLCAASETADRSMPITSLFDPDDVTNPVRDWNMAFIPYCDGSVHSGDNDFDSENRHHRGLINVSAALDVIETHSPNPTRVFLAGSSAGGFGTILGSALVRLKYPDAELYVFNDAGLGVARPDDPAFLDMLLGEWNVERFLPDSCPDCKTSPHMTPLIQWGLSRDPNVKVAAFTAYRDSTIANFFLALDGATFEQAVRDATGVIHEAYPDRYKRFFITGTSHTAAGELDTTQIGGVTLRQWLTAMLANDSAWVDTLQ